MKYVLKDHQGSLAALVNEKSGTEYFSFDACSVKLGFCECSETKALVEQIPTEARSREGNRRNAQTWTYTNMPISFGTTRGFTMHEHLDEFKLINMNGRVYDPLVGRFISPDPFVQLPDYSQSYNRYSYAFNNPLRFSDPSGFFAEGDSTLSPARAPLKLPFLPAETRLSYRPGALDQHRQHQSGAWGQGS
jgi:RHS repeat-associated protein